MHVLAQNIAKRVVQNMGRRMVQHRGVTTFTVDAQADAMSGLELADVTPQNSPHVENRAITLACIGNFDEAASSRFDHATVADLAAALGVEWSLCCNNWDAAIASLSTHDRRFRLVVAVKEA